MHQVVGASGNSNLTVFGILFDYAPNFNANPEFSAFWSDILHKREGISGISISNLIKQCSVYQRYDGSLTTPPCSETVAWHVCISNVGVNQLQLLDYTYALNGIQNYRPIQALNNRTVTTLTA